jgi:chromate reductase, NAD(P)H dehydrogenase (quinone)
MRVIGICGSLRKQSYNLALLRAATELAPPEMEIVIHPLHDLPLYNEDDDPKDLDAAPPTVRAFRRAVADSDGLIAACPEFSHAYSGVLKNALDWLAHGDVLTGLPVTSFSAAPNQGGGVRGQLALREVFFAVGADVFVHYELLVRAAKLKFDASRKLTDSETRDQLAGFLAEFADHVRKAKTPAAV